MYLNLIEIAESFGVSERVVEDWIRIDGMPHVPDRGRLLFDRARVAHWAAAHGLTARAGFLAPEQGAFATDLALEPMLRTGGIWRDVPASSVIELFERIITNQTRVPQTVRALLVQRLKVKGGINWAPVGAGVALPHFSARVTLGRGAGLIALVLLRDAVSLEEPPVDGVAVKRLFFFVPPSPRAHLDTLARLSRAISKGALGVSLGKGASDRELFDALAAAGSTGGVEPGRGIRS